MGAAVTSGLPLGSSGGSFLVQPSGGLMVWTLVVFGISMFLLYKLAWPRIGDALDKRQKAIEESIDTAERTREEAQGLLDEYRERLTAARKQADDIIERANKAADAHVAETKEEAAKTREDLMAQARRDIEQETRRAIQDIRREVADLTVMATEKVTRKTLTEDDQRRLVEETLNDLDFTALAGDSQGSGGS